jgi:phosphoribosylglycinamide formyltransferase-1
MVKLGVLGSGKGSNFVAIQEAILRGDLPAEIVLVASDQPEAGILGKAQSWHLPTHLVPPSRFKTKLEPEREQGLVAELRSHGVEWVILAGYMRVVKAPLLQAYPDRIINIHPSLLPKYPGLEAWRQALDAGESNAGCTVHYVNEVIDGGAILGQAEVPILPGDTATTLHARIQEAEWKLYPEVLKKILR